MAMFQNKATGHVKHENEFDYPAYTLVATRTREEVIAELRNAQADGSLRFQDHDYPSAFQQPIGQRTATLVGKGVATAVKN
ncbi:DUF4148 domain-containing protein [Herbaspirillum sp. GCM10030257]|uniref:DUF4148 domain-containing protein n=1 Tax=Herbaspirillum sp. GCM10030257 TaxID=3273393 RepID=UPI0036077A0C